jgi:hypothetical protein
MKTIQMTIDERLLKLVEGYARKPVAQQSVLCWQPGHSGGEVWFMIECIRIY